MTPPQEPVRPPMSPSIVGPANNVPYIFAIVIMVFICLGFIILLQIMLPDRDNMALIMLIIGVLTPTTVSLLALMKAQETHLSVNSRLDQFMKNAEYAALARGRDEGIKVGSDQANLRTDELSQQVPPKTQDTVP